MIDFDLDTYILNGDTVEYGYLQPCQTVKRGKPEWRTEPGLKFAPKVLQVHPCDFYWILHKEEPLIAFEKSVDYHLRQALTQLAEIEHELNKQLEFSAITWSWIANIHRIKQWHDTVTFYTLNGINTGWPE